jgi:hypothetical protein
MKKIVSILVLSAVLGGFLINTGLYAQDAQTAFPASSFILHNKIWYGYPNAFSLASGTALSYKELKERLRLIPENQAYIQRAGVWNISAWILWGASLGLAGGAMYYMHPHAVNNSPYDARDMTHIFLVSSLIPLLAGSIADQKARENIISAVNNYNLTVMGFPIPAGNK